MTLIVMKERKVLDLPSLLRIALRKIYEPEKFSVVDEGMLMNGIISWKNHLDNKREIGFNAIDEENQVSLEYIGRILKDEADGNLDRRKALFKEHRVDYKKFYRLPEAFVPEDFARAKHYHSLLPEEEQ